jgi:hypothetical protein
MPNGYTGRQQTYNVCVERKEGLPVFDQWEYGVGLSHLLLEIGM